MNPILKTSFVLLKSLFLNYPFINIFIIISLSSCSSFQLDQSNKIIGEWSGLTKNGEKLTLIFEKDKSATLISNNQVMDSTTTGGKVTWELDTTKDPINLDIVFLTKNGERKIAPFIMRYISDRKIIVRRPDNGNRPTSFSMESVENQIVLDKK
jgi:hypothetical protein